MLSLLFIIINTAGCSNKAVPTPSIDNQSRAKSFDDPALPADYVILDRLTGDVTGDGKPKEISLVGRKPNADSNFADDLSIVVLGDPNQNTVK